MCLGGERLNEIGGGGSWDDTAESLRLACEWLGRTRVALLSFRMCASGGRSLYEGDAEADEEDEEDGPKSDLPLPLGRGISDGRGR